MGMFVLFVKMVTAFVQIESVEDVLFPIDSLRDPSTTGFPVSKCPGWTVCARTVPTVNLWMS